MMRSRCATPRRFPRIGETSRRLRNLRRSAMPGLRAVRVWDFGYQARYRRRTPTLSSIRSISASLSYESVSRSMWCSIRGCCGDIARSATRVVITESSTSDTVRSHSYVRACVRSRGSPSRFDRRIHSTSIGVPRSMTSRPARARNTDPRPSPAMTSGSCISAGDTTMHGRVFFYLTSERWVEGDEPDIAALYHARSASPEFEKSPSRCVSGLQKKLAANAIKKRNEADAALL